MTKKDIVAKYLGLPYKHMGRDAKTGLDCWGLIKSIYADHGIEIDDVENYEINWSKKGHDFFATDKHPEWQKVSDPQFMDIVLFKASDLVVNHAGLVLDESRFIQSCRAGVIVCRLGEMQWFKRNAGYYRLKK